MMMHVLTLLGVAQLTTQHAIATAQGRVHGVDKDGYTSYVGIPYGSVTGASGRFKRAGPAPSWQGVRESHDPRCTASSDVEHCLQLDVHVPGAGRTLPVLVWVKGGAGDYDPGALVREGIVVVIVRHRLGPVGFLCSQALNIPGNTGLKDVVQALRWTRDNIVAFSGDPHRVVIGGQGFGAAMVEALVLSPTARGLFHGAVMQSGSVLAPWAFSYDAEERATRLSSKLNSSDLTKVPVRTLARAAEELDVPYLPFALCVEGTVKGEEKIVFEQPHNSNWERNAAPVPLVIGHNSDEGYIFARALRDATVLRSIQSDASVLIPMDLQRDRRDIPAIVNEIRDAYFRNNVTMEAVIKYHGDAYFTSHVHRSARLHAAHPGVYYYRFSHVGGGGVAPERDVTKRGAAHSDELAYLFPAGGRLDDDDDGDDALVRGLLIRLWTNFVKHLNPTPPGSDVTWEPSDPGRPRLLDIGPEPHMADFPGGAEERLWTDLYDRLHARN